MLRYTGLDEAGLTKLAERLGTLLAVGDVVLLEGPMAAGKTTFVRALARGLGVDRPDRVCSPTFNICLIHAGPIPLVHVDLFRLGEAGQAGAPADLGAAAFEALGLEDIEESGAHVLVVEWAELWRRGPSDHLGIEIAQGGSPSLRNLVLRPAGKRARDLVSALNEPVAQEIRSKS